MAAPRRKMENGQFAAMLSAAIAFAGVLISGTNVLVAYINKSKDLDIAARKEFREFVTKKSYGHLWSGSITCRTN
jgi:hypothetical protein